jgi:hypothetical protein
MRVCEHRRSRSKSVRQRPPQLGHQYPAACMNVHHMYTICTPCAYVHHMHTMCTPLLHAHACARARIPLLFFGVSLTHMHARTLVHTHTPCTQELKSRMFELPPPYEGSVSLFGRYTDAQTLSLSRARARSLSLSRSFSLSLSRSLSLARALSLYTILV